MSEIATTQDTRWFYVTGEKDCGRWTDYASFCVEATSPEHAHDRLNQARTGWRHPSFGGCTIHEVSDWQRKNLRMREIPLT